MAMNNYNPPVYYWNFVPRQYIGNPGWHNYYVNESRNVTIVNQTTIINNYSGTNRNRYAYAPGPDPNEVRRVSGNQFTPVQLREANTPGERISGSQYVIYHPRVSETPAARGNNGARPATPAPARYEPFSNVRPSNRYPAYGEQPANPSRTAMETPNNSQPAYNPRPVNNQPPNNPGRTVETPNNNQPDYRQRPSNNNQALPQQNTNSAVTPAQRNQEAAKQIDLRTRRMTETPMPGGVQGQNTNMPKPSPANHVQTTGRPSDVHNPNNGQPVQRAQIQEKKPEQKNDDKPKTREAGNNN